jgi:hypothetical protein
VPYEQLAIRQEHIRLDAAKPMIQRVQQRTLVMVVVVGMSTG